MSPRVDSLPLGGRVRGVTSADGAAIEGFFRAADGDSLRIGRCKRCDASPAIPLSSLRYLEVERQRPIGGGEVLAYLMTGTFLGAIAGGVAGGVYAYHQSRRPNCGDLCGLNWLAVPYLGAGGAAVGFVAGGVVALTRNETYWIGVRFPAP